MGYFNPNYNFPVKLSHRRNCDQISSFTISIVLGLLDVLVQDVTEALPARLRDQDGVTEIPLHLKK
jgi:hypothetical protein